jgi:hypothetical protein
MARVNFSWKTARKFLIYPRTTYFLTIMITIFISFFINKLSLLICPGKKLFIKNPIVCKFIKKKRKATFFYINYRKIFGGRCAGLFFAISSQGKLLCKEVLAEQQIGKGPKRQTSTAAREVMS